MTNNQEKAILATAERLAHELKPIVHGKVQAIEARPATTRDHYGDYLNLLMSLGINSNTAGNKALALVSGRAFVQCGASERGVCDAIQAGLGMPDVADQVRRLGGAS